MSWIDDFCTQLAESAGVGYRLGGTPASEPTALAAMALLAGGFVAPAEAKLRWLADIQAADGSIGISAQELSPGWPTPLAILAWVARTSAQKRCQEPFLPLVRQPEKVPDTFFGFAANSARRAPRSALPQRPPWSRNVRRAVDWLLQTAGNKLPPRGEGHDTTLVGWPWAAGTHSWIEPTAWAVLALKAAGHGSHPRTREAVRLLIDRLLRGGGCNYGNTVVLGQELVPHVQPTGLALLALAGQRDPAGRIQRSVEYLVRVLDENTPPASLAYGLLGMAAHGRQCCMAEEWLATAATHARKRRSALEMALLLLAAAGPAVWATRSASRTVAEFARIRVSGIGHARSLATSATSNVPHDCSDIL